MEQAPLYNAINFSYHVGDKQDRQLEPDGFGLQNMTVRQSVINSLLCPTDPSPPTDMTNADEISEPTGGGDFLHRQRRR